jgi:hypothetical protein
MPDSTQAVSAQTVIPAGPGWSLVTLLHGSDPPTLLETVIAWAISAALDDPERCRSSAWPITAEVGCVRLNDGRWGLKQPNSRYTCGDIYDGDAAACIAELVAMELAAIGAGPRAATGT